eukprot:3819236-Rhodomonas_salina.2
MTEKCGLKCLLTWQQHDNHTRTTPTKAMTENKRSRNPNSNTTPASTHSKKKCRHDKHESQLPETHWVWSASMEMTRWTGQGGMTLGQLASAASSVLRATATSLGQSTLSLR